jgi:hypothetical protein
MQTTIEETAASSYNNGNLQLTVITPGLNKSKSRNYPASVLKRDHGVFTGAKMFADHQTEAERKARSEGSVNNWVGSITKVWAESDGAIKATAKVIDEAFKKKLENLKNAGLLKEMGISIRAVGEGTGSSPVVIESISACHSVDFVTYAGAGGAVEVMESMTVGDDHFQPDYTKMVAEIDWKNFTF